VKYLILVSTLVNYYNMTNTNSNSNNYKHDQYNIECQYDHNNIIINS